VPSRLVSRDRRERQLTATPGPINCSGVLAARRDLWDGSVDAECRVNGNDGSVAECDVEWMRVTGLLESGNAECKPVVLNIIECVLM